MTVCISSCKSFVTARHNKRIYIQSWENFTYTHTHTHRDMPLSPSSINLVPVQAGKVTIGLALHWPYVTVNSGITICDFTALERGVQCKVR